MKTTKMVKALLAFFIVIHLVAYIEYLYLYLGQTHLPPGKGVKFAFFCFLLVSAASGCFLYTLTTLQIAYPRMFWRGSKDWTVIVLYFFFVIAVARLLLVAVLPRP
jgi:hypothetical protein